MAAGHGDAETQEPSAAPPALRPRLKDGHEDIAAVVGNHARNAAFLPYDDEDDSQDGKVRCQPNMILKNQDMWKEIAERWPPLTFT